MLPCTLARPPSSAGERARLRTAQGRKRREKGEWPIFDWQLAFSFLCRNTTCLRDVPFVYATCRSFTRRSPPNAPR
jgi:hypothetical protein